MNDEYVIVIGGVEYPAALLMTREAKTAVTPTEESLQKILADHSLPEIVVFETAAMELQEYVGVEFISGFLDDDLVWVKAQDFVVESQWLNLYNIIGDCQVTAGTMGAKRTMRLQVKSLRMPISSMRTVIRTIINPLEG